MNSAKPRYHVETDVPYNQPVQEFLKTLRAYSGKVEDFNPEGPGGGNPCVSLSFEERRHASSYLKFLYPDDDPRFREKRISVRTDPFRDFAHEAAQVLESHHGFHDGSDEYAESGLDAQTSSLIERAKAFAS